MGVGGGAHRIAFFTAPDLDLMTEGSPGDKGGEDEGPPSLEFRESSDLAGLFPDPAGRYDFATLASRSGIPPANLAEKLWERVWRGQLTNDTFLTLRRVLAGKFKLPDRTFRDRRAPRLWGRHAGLRERKERGFFPGNWHLLPVPEFSGDLLEAEERKKDRARLLLERYGILFRELLQREHPALTWSSVFRSLRIMELSGEVLAGYFFEGIPGPQFISRHAFLRLRQSPREDQTYWVNAADPASLCGVPLESFKGKLPPRLPSNHLVYHGPRLVMVSKRYGKELTFLVPPDTPHFPEYLAPLNHLLTRRFQPLRRIAVEAINGEPAPQSVYLPALRTSFEVIVGYKSVNLSRSR